eukprot:3859335-Pyramimonas_sp.AAC.1
MQLGSSREAHALRRDAATGVRSPSYARCAFLAASAPEAEDSRCPTSSLHLTSPYLTSPPHITRSPHLLHRLVLPPPPPHRMEWRRVEEMAYWGASLGSLP